MDQVLEPDLWIFGAAAAAFDSTVSAADLGAPTRVSLLHDDVIYNETRPRLSLQRRNLFEKAPPCLCPVACFVVKFRPFGGLLLDL